MGLALFAGQQRLEFFYMRLHPLRNLAKQRLALADWGPLPGSGGTSRRRYCRVQILRIRIRCLPNDLFRRRIDHRQLGQTFDGAAVDCHGVPCFKVHSSPPTALDWSSPAAAQAGVRPS
jgi:hypothetical protein